MLQPSGPSIHLVTCSGFVQQSNTSARGASTTRVTTISRSEGVAKVVAPTLSAVVIVVLLVLKVVEVVVEAFVAGVPEAAVALGPLRDLLERRRLEPAGAPLRLASAGDQAGALEHAQVLRDRGPAHGEWRRQLLDR